MRHLKHISQNGLVPLHGHGGDEFADAVAVRPPDRVEACLRGGRQHGNLDRMRCSPLPLLPLCDAVGRRGGRGFCSALRRCLIRFSARWSRCTGHERDCEDRDQPNPAYRTPRLDEPRTQQRSSPPHACVSPAQDLTHAKRERGAVHGPRMTHLNAVDPRDGHHDVKKSQHTHRPELGSRTTLSRCWLDLQRRRSRPASYKTIP